LTDPCKHGWIARIWQLSGEQRALYFERALSFLSNRERSLPAGIRNDVFYSGTSAEVLDEIKGGGVSRYGLISEGLEEEARLYLTVNIHI